MADKVIKNLKKGGFILIDGVPCEIVSINISKSGKHGAAKARVEGMGMFDGRRRSIIKPADAKVQVPILNKKQAQVLAITGDKAQLMDLTDYSTFDLDVPKSMKGKLKSGEEIMYYEIEGKKTLESPK
ncbi:MAG: translation initiation factor IF-5A [Candidatus Aenigmarchaeota archaeon]|nr:translation initiation factor IF-5A [Candidatus Aenigmarchaeota archaeon]